MTAIHDLSAAELSSAYARGDLSPVTVTGAVLEQIARWEPHINAMYLVHGQAALDAAAQSEARWRSGSPLSPIDGVPVTIKENVYTKGDPALLGTAATDRKPKEHDAEIVAPLRAQQVNGNDKYFTRFKELYPSINLTKP